MCMRPSFHPTTRTSTLARLCIIREENYFPTKEVGEWEMLRPARRHALGNNIEVRVVV